MILANEMHQAGMIDQVTDIYAVYFDDVRVNQHNEPGEGMTGYETYLLVTEYSNDTLLSLVVDQGIKCTPVVLHYSNDPKVTITQVYKNEEFLRELSKSDVQEIISQI